MTFNLLHLTQDEAKRLQKTWDGMTYPERKRMALQFGYTDVLMVERALAKAVGPKIEWLDSYSDGMCGFVKLGDGKNVVTVHWSVDSHRGITSQERAADVAKRILGGEDVDAGHIKEEQR